MSKKQGKKSRTERVGGGIVMSRKQGTTLALLVHSVAFL